jgi:hypothetical protein
MNKLDDLKLSLVKAIFASLDSLERDDQQRVNMAVANGVNKWFSDRPGLIDDTQECVVCHEPTTKDNPIKSVHGGTSKYLCNRCCDGVTGSPAGHSEPLRFVIGKDLQ